MENKITHLFEEQKVNISKMSRKTGIPYGTLYDIAKGKTPFEKVGIGHLIKIAHEFGMTADELVGGEVIDPNRYELCQIYDSLDAYGQKALFACACGIHDAFVEEMTDAIYEAQALDQMTDELLEMQMGA